MKKLNKTVIASIIISILTFPGINCFHQRTIVVKKTDVKQRHVTDGINAAALVPLEITRPRHMIFSEPFDRCMRPVPNLEENNGYGEANIQFLVPSGTLNVALGKPVYSSDNNPIIGSIRNVNDGRKEYGKHGGYVELGPGLQNITIDLLQKCEIYAVVVWHSYRIGPVYLDVIVQVSNDIDFSKDVRTLFNNDSDNSSGLGTGQNKNYRERHQGKIIDAKGIRARYVRLYSNGNSGNELNHYLEVEVHGKPVK